LLLRGRKWWEAGKDSEELCNLYASPVIIIIIIIGGGGGGGRMINSRRIR
jgi:H+/gluconate symporter-like permease